jgi:glycosyltransferase involved in cell wall biosynthesis
MRTRETAAGKYMSSPLVSIIIPCYNAARYVGEAIESALAQTYPRKEVIVIDDGSTDNSVDVIQSYRHQVRWETGPNRGGCAARNRGLELAGGEFIQFLDADDLLLPEKIEQQMLLCRDDLCWLVTCDRFEMTENDRVSKLVMCDFSEHSTPRWIIENQQLRTSAPLHIAQSVRAVGGFDEQLPCSQEYDLHLRLVLGGARVLHVSKPLWINRVRPGSVSSDISLVTRQHVRIFERAFNIACRKLHGLELDDAKQALAEACIRDLRRCLQNNERTLGREFIRLANEFHHSGGLGFYRYNRLAYGIAKLFGPRTAEKIVALRRGRGRYYRRRSVVSSHLA